MSKRRVSFGGVTVVGPGDGKNLPDETESAPSASQDQQKPAKMRKNNKIIENSDFNFGTADQRAETQNFVNEKGTRMKTGLHTIDSDDEEENAINEKKLSYKKLDMEKVKGLEEDPEDDQDEDGNMITGFNLKDEMEEGEFDSTGQFHFKKREDTDHWLESVDWKKVRKDEKKDEAMEQETEKEEEKEQDTEKEILAKILAKMKPKETVTKTLQRLGKSSAGKIPAWKQKRMEKLARRKQAGKSDTSKYMIEEEEGETAGNAEELKTMTDLVDRLSRRGYYDVYTDTYEKIKHKLNTMDKSPDDELDMFGDGLDSGKSVQSNDALEDSETMWEYKVGKEGKLTGPLKTSAMIKLKESATGEVFCRRLNTNSTFYNIARVDFDLW